MATAIYMGERKKKEGKLTGEGGDCPLTPMTVLWTSAGAVYLLSPSNFVSRLEYV
jgi:hypothetical protein